MKPQIILFVFILFTISCATQKEFPRTYGNICSEITLNPNKTFEYRESCTGLGGEFIRKGTWKYGIGDTILLNTYKQPKNIKTTYKGNVNPDFKKKVKILIRDFEIKLSYAGIEINDGEMAKSADENGIVEFETDKIINVKFYYLGEVSEKIEISNPEFNDIEILIRDLDLDIVPKYFTDMPFIVTKNKIVLYPNDKEKRYEKKRIKRKSK